MREKRKFTHTIIALALIVALLGGTALVYASSTVSVTPDSSAVAVTTGQTVYLSLTVTNNSETTRDVTISESTAFELVELVEGSVKVDGVLASYTYSSGKLTVSLSDIPAGGSRTITYEAVAIADGHLSRGGTKSGGLWGSISISILPNPISYTVTYDPNDGAGASYEDQNLAENSDYIVKNQSDTNITRSGYEFIGWNTAADGSGTDYKPGDTITMTEDITLYAQWEKDPDEYGVTYTFESADQAIALPQEVLSLLPADGGTYVDGSKVTAIVPTQTRVETNTGICTFDGWDEDTKTVNGDTVTFTGTWRFDQKTYAAAYTVVYDANEGSGNHTDADLTAGSDYIVKSQSDTNITRSGYIFLGWNTAADGNGTGYEPGDQISMTNNVTLYAQWEQLLNTVDHFAYICGYPDGSVRIDNDITRAEAASIFYRLLNRQDTASGNWFSDVPDSKWYTTQVNHLASLGILSGYPDGTFRPDVPITRAEFAAIASKFDSLSDTGSNVFDDVPDNHWAVGFINSAYAKGWVTGYPDGTFQPDNNITRAEVVSIVNKMLARKIGLDSLEGVENPYNDIDSGHWAYPNVIEASFGHEYSRNSDNTEAWSDFHWQ